MPPGGAAAHPSDPESRFWPRQASSHAPPPPEDHCAPHEAHSRVHAQLFIISSFWVLKKDFPFFNLLGRTRAPGEQQVQTGTQGRPHCLCLGCKPPRVSLWPPPVSTIRISWVVLYGQINRYPATESLSPITETATATTRWGASSRLSVQTSGTRVTFQPCKASASTRQAREKAEGPPRTGTRQHGQAQPVYQAGSRRHSSPRLVDSRGPSPGSFSALSLSPIIKQCQVF